MVQDNSPDWPPIFDSDGVKIPSRSRIVESPWGPVICSPANVYVPLIRGERNASVRMQMLEQALDIDLCFGMQ